MDHPDLTVPNFMENPIGLKRVRQKQNSGLLLFSLFLEILSAYKNKYIWITNYPLSCQ